MKDFALKTLQEWENVCVKSLFFQSATGPSSLIPTICGSNAGQHGELDTGVDTTAFD